MNDQPLVSIVTPSLNQGKFIRETIDSVLSQEYPNLEYLVVDGGSNDGTLEILKSYGSRVRWVSEIDSGQSQAINKGWQQTSGEIVTWLNADDLLTSGAVWQAIGTLRANSSLGGTYGDCMYISENGNVIKPYPVKKYDYDLLVTKTENFIPQPGTFLRRSIVELAGKLDESFHYVLDYDLWLRMGMYAPMVYLPFEMGRARLHDSAKTLRSTRNFSDEFIRMYDKLLSHPEFPLFLSSKKQTILYRAYVHSASFSFWGGDIASARQMLWNAWKQQPFPLHRTFWLLWIFAVFGTLGLWLAETLHGNPFRLEKYG